MAQSRGTTLSYYDADALETITALDDAAGTIQNSYTFDAWGTIRNQTGSTQNQFIYTGREVGEAGLTFYRARYYNTSLGRFISEDPLKYGILNSLYAYAGNNPTNFTDPTGHISKAIAGPIPGGGTAFGPVGQIIWGFQCYRCGYDQYVDGQRQYSRPTEDNHMRHCWTSCKTVNHCGEMCYAALSLINEVRDPAWNDITSNVKGQKCAKNGKDCKLCCLECEPGGNPPSAN